MVERTVLVRRSSLGDVVLMGAVSGALAGPVTVVTSPQYVQIAQALQGVQEVIAWPGDATVSQMARRLPRGHLVDLHGDAKTAALAALRGGRWSRIRKHSVRRRLRLMGMPFRRDPVVSLYGAAAGVQPMRAPWIAGSAKRSVLAVLPGAAWATKRYDPARLAAAADAWRGPVVVLGSDAERQLVESVARGIPGAKTVVERGFTQTLRVLAETRVAVGMDSGLLHVAAACGARVVALFGPTHPDDGFFVHAGEVVQRSLACRPCSLHGRRRCPAVHHRCMDLDARDVRVAIGRQEHP